MANQIIFVVLNPTISLATIYNSMFEVWISLLTDTFENFRMMLKAIVGGGCDRDFHVFFKSFTNSVRVAKSSSLENNSKIVSFFSFSIGQFHHLSSNNCAIISDSNRILISIEGTPPTIE